MNNLDKSNSGYKDENDSLYENSVEKINIKEFFMGERICKCSYGFIYYCKKIKSNKIYSMKVLKKIKILENKLVERQYNEFKNLSLLYHPFIAELKGFNCTDPVNLYYLEELVSGGSLKLYIKSKHNLPINFAQFYSASIITVLDYLHKKNIIHRDLRPENILLNYDGYIKLVSFNCSKKLDNNMTYSICGSPEYYSPEMVNKSGYNKGVDFWQLGILIYEMIVGYTPFIDLDPVRIFKKIIKGKVKFPKDTNNNIKSIIRKFLIFDKNKRLGCTQSGIYEIISQPFYNNFDWEGLLRRKIKPPFFPNIHEFKDINNNITFEDNLENNKEALPKEIDPFYNWQ